MIVKMDCLLGGQKEAKMKLKKLLEMMAVTVMGVFVGYAACAWRYGLWGCCDDYEDDFDDDFDDDFEDEDAEKTEKHYTDLNTTSHPSGEPAEERITVEG